MKYTLTLIILIVALFQVSCKLKFEDRGDLVSSSQRSSHSLNTMDRALDNSRYNAKYGVKTYRIIYQTVNADGDQVEASGLLVVPQKSSSSKSPVMIYHHPTITLNSKSPSFQHRASSIYSKTASLGYIVIAPDYLGYGKFSKENHPFLHAKTLASSSIDMLRASKKWLKKHDIETNKQLFLYGYSEGGYASLSTHKELQKHHSRRYPVTGSVSAAGPYDLSASFKSWLDDDTLASPTSIGFLVKSYDDVYDSKLISTIINSRYQDTVDYDIDEGTYTINDLDDSLSHRTSRLIRSGFLSDTRNGYNTKISKYLKKNDIYDWKPKAPIRFVHGEDDEIIPYSNATTAVDEMIANGATDIELVDCDIAPFSAKHHICSVFAYDYAIDFFNNLANNL